MSIRKDDNGNVIQLARLNSSQALAIGAVSTQSAAFTSDGVIAVRLLTDTACYVAIGSNPTATTASTLLAAGVPECFLVLKGESLAVIGTSGTLNITELS